MSRILELQQFLLDIGDLDAPVILAEEEEAVIELEREGLLETPEKLFAVFEEEPEEAIWIREPVSPIEFLNDPYYSKAGGALYPLLREKFVEVFDGNSHEVILAGSISWGKSYFMAWCMFRQLYELSCLANPQNHLGIAPETPIVMANLSVTGNQAKNVCYRYVKNLVDTSPYFKEHFPPNPRIDASLQFPNNVVYQPGNSSEFSAIGTNLIAGAVDEANFLISAKKLAHERMQANEVDHAKVLYRALARRIELRFQASKGWKGRLFLASSRIYEGDFIDQQIKAKQDNPGVTILDYAIWDVFGFKPGTETRHPHTGEVLYTGKTFDVAIGNAGDSSRILVEDDVVPPETNVIHVPYEYYATFSGDDLEGCIRDIAGKSTLAVNPWIPNRRAIQAQAQDTYTGHPLVHPFPKDVMVVEPGLADTLDLSVLSLESVSYEGVGSNRSRVSILRPRRSPDVPRFAHFDLAINNDAAGFAMGYIAGYTTAKIRRDRAVEVEIREVPIIVFEIAAAFQAPIGGEIEFGQLREILYRLRDVGGFSFASVTFDQFQSRDTQQILSAKGFTCEELSVDRDIGPYTVLRNGVTEGWIVYYKSPTVIRELTKLRRVLSVSKKVKVDHPEFDPENPRRKKGSKDVTDAMAAVVAKIMELQPATVMAPAPMDGKMSAYAPPVNMVQWQNPHAGWLVDEYVRRDAERHFAKQEAKKRPR